MANRRHKLKGKLFRLIFQAGKSKACLKVVFFLKRSMGEGQDHRDK